jgi:dTDP-4-dehydrorhamnose reductase
VEESEYGYQKRIAEGKVLETNSNALVVRLGWQIGENSEGNNMLNFFEKQMKEKGKIEASTMWKPATSFIIDSVESMYKLGTSDSKGIYLLDSNEKWSFYEIAEALSRQNNDKWTIVPTDTFVYDQRMIDKRSQMPSLSERIIELI